MVKPIFNNDIPISYEAENSSFFRKHLAAWGKSNLREFPWRTSNSPFQLLLAEMMLRRTNALQVIPIYEKAIRLFPDPKTLAFASIQEVFDLLRPLGLEWRAKNIRLMAEYLVRHFDNQVPSSYEKLKELPGVGDYVASAVCCFAFNQSLPIIDTNTVRVVGRYFGFTTHAESRRRRHVREAIIAVTSKVNTSNYNYAFLDFASLICKAGIPKCSSCPLISRCFYGRDYSEGMTS